MSFSRFSLALLTALAACGYSPTDYGSTPSYTMTVASQALTLTQGTVTTTSVRLAREANSTGDITVQAAGVPFGLVVDVVPTAVNDSLTLRVVAAAAINPGNYNFRVVANAYSGTREVAVAVTVTPATANAPLAFKAVFAGQHTCALTEAGDAYCWGVNTNGELGNGTVSASSAVPVAVSGGRTFATLAVSKSSGATCGITTAGVAYCWGDNRLHQLGDGTTTRRLTPTAVAGRMTFKSIAIGNGHTCGIETSGVAFCWGASATGALGNGIAEEQFIPAPIAGGAKFRDIVAGDEYTCARTEAGAAFCWGLGTQGQLGTGGTASARTAVGVAGGLFFRTLVGGGHSVCGLTFEGKAYCWGNNFFGTLGIGSSGTTGGPGRQLEPVAVSGGLTFRSISAGLLTTCGVTFANEGFCWGYNFGAVGDGSNDHRLTPTAIIGGFAFGQLSAGAGHSCGITTERSMLCWGDNPNGEVGDGSTQLRLAPVPVSAP